MGVGTRTSTEGNPGDEPVAQCFTEFPQAIQFAIHNTVTGLDLESKHAPAVVFDHEVDLIAVPGPPVPNRDGVI